MEGIVECEFMKGKGKIKVREGSVVEEREKVTWRPATLRALHIILQNFMGVTL